MRGKTEPLGRSLWLALGSSCPFFCWLPLSPTPRTHPKVIPTPTVTTSKRSRAGGGAGTGEQPVQVIVGIGPVAIDVVVDVTHVAIAGVADAAARGGDAEAVDGGAESLAPSGLSAWETQYWNLSTFPLCPHRRRRIHSAAQMISSRGFSA